jgi:hypothetical protein
MELQWRQLQMMKTGKGRQWAAAIFRGEDGEEARRLHGVGDG